MDQFADHLPETGIGEDLALSRISALATDAAARLGDPLSLAHMDPPPPRIASELVGLNATLNQNLLHPDLSPFATKAETTVIQWLLPHFGMADGHLCAGSSLANLEALWAAREHGATQVVASAEAHLSVRKAADILGLPFTAVAVDADGRLDRAQLPDLSKTALVLTAGTTGRGVIDSLAPADALWVHVDAAWAGPMRLTRHAGLLDGIEHAHSIAVSAHKWFLQPKDSALVMFASSAATDPVRYGGSYLATPNVGVQGSRSAAGVALLGTLLAFGRAGIAHWIEGSIALSQGLAARIDADPRLELKQHPETGVLNWRPTGGLSPELLRALGTVASSVRIDDALWVRHVAANPNADIDAIWERIQHLVSDV